MKRYLFRRWNWEVDYGVDPLDATGLIPENHCVVFIDALNRLCRAHVFGPNGGDNIYDYFCDGQGRILEKRSYCESGEIDLVIDYAYEGEEWVVETCRSSRDSTFEVTHRRKVQQHPLYGAGERS